MILDLFFSFVFFHGNENIHFALLFLLDSRGSGFDSQIVGKTGDGYLLASDIEGGAAGDKIPLLFILGIV